MRYPVALSVALYTLLVVGCSERTVSAPYEPITLEPPPQNSDGAGNAYMEYIEQSDLALKTTGLAFDAKDTRANREVLLSDLGPLMERLAKSTGQPCTFAHEPSLPFEGGAHHEGWILLGRALAWQIEESVAKADWDEAVRWTVVATTFGTDLGGGDFSDASLGYGIIDDARRAIAKHLPLIPQEALTTLATGLDLAVARWPSPAQTVSNESQNMLLAVKALQDAHENGELSAFADSLYGRSRSAVTGLADLDEIKRSEFFRALIQERERVADQLLVSAEVHGAKRSDVVFTLDGRARVLADQFFTTGDPWLSMRDRTQARTHLFATTARIYSHIAEHGESPKDLSGFVAAASIDPYTGRSLNYEHQGRGFLLYSCGENGVHDQGETNADRTSPDMYLKDAVL